MKESNKQAFKEFLKQKPDAKHLLPIERIAEETFVPGRSNGSLSMNPITGQVNNIIDATQRNYNTQLIPLKSDRSSKGQKQLIDQLQNFKDVQVGHMTDQQIMKEKA